MRVVLDTVVVVRALINPHGRWGRLIFEKGNEYETVISPEILAEILDVISRPKLLKRLALTTEAPQIEAVLARLEAAFVVEPKIRLKVCRDPKDDKFFECAIEGRAEYIISEDRDILDIAEYEGVKTLSAEQFLQLLAST